MFKQSFVNGCQRENADDWTKYGDPWSHRRDKLAVKVKFADQTVNCVPYDMPVIGYETTTVGTLRLWQCEAEEELNFDAFNAQDYVKALEKKNKAEDITRVLYPNDSTWEGKRLRVKQQYVLSSASLQDILRDYRQAHGKMCIRDRYVFVQQYGGVIFVVLSGCCATLGSRSFRRGCIVFSCGMLISLVTFGMYRLGMASRDVIVWFGVLHLLGACMMLYPVYKKLPTQALAAVGVVLVEMCIRDRARPDRCVNAPYAAFCLHCRCVS